MNEGSGKADWRKRPQGKHLHDAWILSRLDATARAVNTSWSEYRMQEGAELLYHFFWSDFCDWYLEASKSTREDSDVVLRHVLGEALKLLHPLCPHVTEELFHGLPGVREDEYLMCQPFPVGESF